MGKGWGSRHIFFSYCSTEFFNLWLNVCEVYVKFCSELMSLNSNNCCKYFSIFSHMLDFNFLFVWEMCCVWKIWDLMVKSGRVELVSWKSSLFIMWKQDSAVLFTFWGVIFWFDPALLRGVSSSHPQTFSLFISVVSLHCIVYLPVVGCCSVDQSCRYSDVTWIFQW